MTKDKQPKAPQSPGPSTLSLVEMRVQAAQVDATLTAPHMERGSTSQHG